MSQSCPISLRSVDSNLIRIISFQVAILSLIFIFTHTLTFALLLLFDFSMRLFRYTKLSPFQVIGEFIITKFNIKPKYSNEAPKRFALFLGFAMAWFLLLFTLLGFIKTALIIAGILVLCTIIETILNFCIGCKIYYFMKISKGIFVK